MESITIKAFISCSPTVRKTGRHLPVYIANGDRIAEEAQYDGFYAVITNLEGNISEILKINRQRWEIEENYRIMKSEFEAGPVYARREDRIKAHFLTCYISLLVYRLLEKN